MKRATLPAAWVLAGLAGLLGPLAGEGEAAEIRFPAALAGHAVPGGGTYSTFGPTSVNTWGEVVFPAAVAGGSAPGGLFLVSPLTGTRAIAMTGDVPPDLTFPYAELFPVHFADFLGAAIGASGDVVFTATFEIEGAPAPPFGGIYRDTGGALSPIVQWYDPEPEAIDPAHLFSAFGVPSLLHDGEIAFSAVSRLGEVLVYTGVYVTVDGMPTRVAFEGEPAPGLPGWVYADFGDPAYHRVGGEPVLVFPAEVEAPAPPGIVHRAIFRLQDGVVSLLALEGDPAPGGGIYGALFTGSPALVGSEVAFTDGEGLYFFPHPSMGPPVTLARTGGTPPGSVGGVYGDFPFSPCMLYTDTGPWILFAAAVTGGSTSGGLFISNYNFGSLFPSVFARVGDAAPGGGGAYSAFPTRPSCALTSDFPFGNGSIAYTADLAGGGPPSGVFVLPEPGAAAWLAGSALLAGSRARRQRPE